MSQPQQHAINFQGKLVVVKKDCSDEPRHEFIKRSWWIARNLNKYDSIEMVENLSHIWVSHTIHKASYEQEILNKIKKMN